MSLPKMPIDPTGYQALQIGTFVRYNGASCALKTGETAVIVRRSAEGLMKNSFARVGLIGRKSESVCHVAAYEVEPIESLGWGVRE